MAVMDYDHLQRLLQALQQYEVQYAIFGGAALNLHGIARFTEDVDLFVAPEDSNIERLRLALFSVFDDPAIEEISTADLLGDYPAVQYVPPGGGFHLDIITRLGEAFRFEDLEVVTRPLGDLEVQVVSPLTLYRMKKDTVRLRDRADAEMLRELFDLEKED